MTVVVAVAEAVNIYKTQPADVALTWVPVLRFQDAAGNWWQRAGYEPIQPLEASPLT